MSNGNSPSANPLADALEAAEARVAARMANVNKLFAEWMALRSLMITEAVTNGIHWREIERADEDIVEWHLEIQNAIRAEEFQGELEPYR